MLSKVLNTTKVFLSTAGCHCRSLPNQSVRVGALTTQQALARSTLDRPRTSESNTFIFSTRQLRAVSVASPTFS